MSLEISRAGARSQAAGSTNQEGIGNHEGIANNNINSITDVANRHLLKVQAEGDRLFAMACQHYDNHRWAQLIATCDAMLTQNLQPNGEKKVWAIEAKARACHDLGRWEDYLALCRTLLELKPDEIEYLQGAVRGCMSTGRYLEALPFLSHLMSITSSVELIKWALSKREEACTLQAQADRQAILALITANESDRESRIPPTNHGALPHVW